MPTEFETAFQNARKQGLKQFNYQGKPYTTQYREEKVLQDVLNEYPALQNVYNPQNTSVMLANQQRLQQLKQIGGGDRGMETWFPDDPGDEKFPNPNKGKYTFEYYNQDVFKDDNQLKTSLYLDALHGMKKDSNWQTLRNEFNQNWKPDELEWIKKKHQKEANKGESLAAYVDRTIIDAYLRGGLNPMSDEDFDRTKYNDEYAQLYRGKIQENGKVIDPYSKTQRELIKKMQQYLKTKKL